MDDVGTPGTLTDHDARRRLADADRLIAAGHGEIRRSAWLVLAMSVELVGMIVLIRAFAGDNGRFGIALIGFYVVSGLVLLIYRSRTRRHDRRFLRRYGLSILVSIGLFIAAAWWLAYHLDAPWWAVAVIAAVVAAPTVIAALRSTQR